MTIQRPEFARPSASTQSNRAQVVLHAKGILRTTLAAALLVGGLANPVAAQTAPKVSSFGDKLPTSGIYIGNSFFYYNNSLHGHVTNLLQATPEPRPRFRGVSVTISGSGLNWHPVESYFAPDGIGQYSFAPGNKVVFNKPTEKLFDAAIMMDCSQCPLHPQLKDKFTEFTKKHSDTVRKYGAKPVLFMSWAYADAPEMTAQLAEAYTAAGNANDALVIPAGLAFARSIATKPELNLYVPDLRHPSLAGTYLAACTTYATLFKRSPVGLSYTAGLDEATAKHLQETAWATTEAYFGK